MANPNDITAYRKKQKSRRNMMRLGVLFVAAACLLVFWFNKDKITEALENMTSPTIQSDMGFPISLPGSATYSFQSFDSGLSLLTDTYLYIYTTNAAQTLAMQHGYSNPVQKTGNKRVLVYDANSYEFSLYHKSDKVYEVVLEDKIVYGTVTSDEKVIIITSSTRYSNVLYVYDQKGNWLYTRKFVDENAMQAQLSPDGKQLYVSTIGVENGDVVSKLYCYDITSTDNALWQTYISKNSIPYHMQYANDRLMVLCDNYIASFLPSDGSEIGSFVYSGLLIDSTLTGSSNTILYQDDSSNKTMLISFDFDCEMKGNAVLPANTRQVLTYGDFTFTLEGQNLCQYSSELVQSNSIPLSEEFSQLVLVNNTAYLLGYDKVISQSLIQ